MCVCVYIIIKHIKSIFNIKYFYSNVLCMYVCIIIKHLKVFLIYMYVFMYYD
jgi:hypothetical protein